MKTWTTWLTAAVSVALGGCGQGGQAREVHLTVLTYNVHIGKGMDDKVDLARQARVIARLAPDIVALQEVDRRTARSAGVDQFAELVRLTGMQGVYCKTLDYDGGEFGIALLSRRAIVEHTFHRLPLEKGHEQRYLIEATLEAPAGAPGRAAMKELLTQWTLATPADVPTFPARAPLRTLDYILYRPPGAFAVENARVVDESLASDHRPVRAVLKLRP
ncbi:MAG: hypothetical protein NTV86_15240 [Planctomycetota bacterium]|nr:hypothetical protein [Planctomycetota bacterium]